MEYKINDLSGYIKDGRTNAVLNTDNDSLSAYKKRKKRDSSINAMQEQINILNDKFDLLLEKLAKITEERK